MGVLLVSTLSTRNEGLARVLAMSDGQNIRGQSPGAIPACPNRFQPLSFYSWPTDEEDDPELEYCLATRSPTTAPEKDDAPEPTGAPTISPTEWEIETALCSS